MTVIFALILIALGISGFTRVVFNEINNVSESMMEQFVDSNVVLNPTTSGFELAFGIWGSNYLDPSIGTIRIQ